MRRWPLALVLAAIAGGATAQPSGAPEGGFTQLFISPCGEPYRAGPNDPYPVAVWFAQTDTNHDGAIDLAELRFDAKGFFDFLDRNHDGVLDSFEISAYEHQVIPDVLAGQHLSQSAGFILVQGAPPDHGPLGPSDSHAAPDLRLEGAGPYNLLAEAEPLMAADTDLNGRITWAEMLAATDKRFKRLDKDGDGKLTLAELPRTRADASGEGRPRRR